MLMSILSEINIVSKKISSECPVCLFACRDRADVESVMKEGCCTECYVNFRYVMGEKWDKGERPKVSAARRKMGYDLHN